MSKSLKGILCFILVTALAVMTVLFLRYHSLGKELKNVDQQLTASRENWERIAAEKEELQKELKAKRNELKEAKLSLTEATERAAELREDIAALQEEIRVLDPDNPLLTASPAE